MYGITIIGAGRVGLSLAAALKQTGYRIDTVLHRGTPSFPAGAAILKPYSPDSLKEIHSDIVFITTQDDGVERIAKEYAREISASPKAVFHTSGSLSSGVLAPLRNKGIDVGSMHPLVSISRPFEGVDGFAGVYFCIEGDAAAIGIADDIARGFAGYPFTIETKFKPLYHAAAVTAAGHISALFDTALELIETCGLNREDGRKVLLPLLTSTAANLAHQMPEDALTGPYARIEMQTFAAHLASLDEYASPEVSQIFLSMAARSVEMTRRRSGKNAANAALLERIIMAKSSRK